MIKKFLNNSKNRIITTFILVFVILVTVFFEKIEYLYLEKKILSCNEKGNYEKNCYESLINGTLEKSGLIKAFDVLSIIYGEDDEFASDCHGYTHSLGAATYKLFHLNKEVEFTPKASYCGFGFYHGFMEELLYEGGTIDEARSFCSYTAKILSSNSRHSEGACYHGIGHGAVDGSDPRAWGSVEKIISPGLALCERVGENENHKSNCASGVFNSLAIMFKDSKYRLSVDKKDPYKICESQGPNYFKEACYEQMNTLVFGLTNFNLKESLFYILKIDDKKYADMASDSLASYAPAKRKRGLTEKERRVENYKIIDSCKAFKENISIACIRGYGAGLVEFGAPKKEHEEAFDFCQNDKLNSDEKRSCFNRVLYILAVINTKEKVMSLCLDYVSKTYLELCKELK